MPLPPGILEQPGIVPQLPFGPWCPNASTKAAGTGAGPDGGTAGAFAGWADGIGHYGSLQIKYAAAIIQQIIRIIG